MLTAPGRASWPTKSSTEPTTLRRSFNKQFRISQTSPPRGISPFVMHMTKLITPKRRSTTTCKGPATTLNEQRSFCTVSRRPAIAMTVRVTGGGQLQASALKSHHVKPLPQQLGPLACTDWGICNKNQLIDYIFLKIKLLSQATTVAWERMANGEYSQQRMQQQREMQKQLASWLWFKIKKKIRNNWVYSRYEWY